MRITSLQTGMLRMAAMQGARCLACFETHLDTTSPKHAGASCPSAGGNLLSALLHLLPVSGMHAGQFCALGAPCAALWAPSPASHTLWPWQLACVSRFSLYSTHRVNLQAPPGQSLPLPCPPFRPPLWPWAPHYFIQQTLRSVISAVCAWMLCQALPAQPVGHARLLPGGKGGS